MPSKPPPHAMSSLPTPPLGDIPSQSNTPAITMYS